MDILTPKQIRLNSRSITTGAIEEVLRARGFAFERDGDHCRIFAHREHGTITVPAPIEDIDAVTRIAKRLELIDGREAGARMAAEAKKPLDLRKHLSPEIAEKFGAYQVGDINMLYDKEHPFLELAHNKKGTWQGEAAALERIGASVKPLIASAEERFRIKVQDADDRARIIQPDLDIDTEVAKGTQHFVADFIHALTEAAGRAEHTAERRFGLLVELDNVGIPYKLVPCETAEEASASVGKMEERRHPGEPLQVPFYGADLIPREAAEHIGDAVRKARALAAGKPANPLAPKKRYEAGFAAGLRAAERGAGNAPDL